MPRHITNSAKHSLINTLQRSSCNTITHGLSLLIWLHRKIRKRGAKFFYIPPKYPPWCPPTTIFSILWRNGCETNARRQWRTYRKECISVFGQLNCSRGKEFKLAEWWEKWMPRKDNYVEKWRKKRVFKMIYLVYLINKFIFVKNDCSIISAYTTTPTI